MRGRPRPLPGTWLAIGLLAAAICAAAWVRAGRVVLPTAGDGRGAAMTPGWPDMRIDINAASAAELDVLPGLGPRLAERIADDRAARGPFASVDDLARVPGVGERLVEQIRPFAVAGTESDD
jgi:competence ComEA-like helix-hairpin-helix protein